MRRIYFLQQWFNPSDAAVEEALSLYIDPYGPFCRDRSRLRAGDRRDRGVRLRQLLEQPRSETGGCPPRCIGIWQPTGWMWPPAAIVGDDYPCVLFD
jgi:hypothetical protein